MKKAYEIALCEKELDEILNNKSITYIFNPEKEYQKLKVQDQKTLKHLVKAAKALDNVFLKQDHSENLEMKSFLQVEIDKGDSRSKKAYELFKIFNGIEGNDGLSKAPIRIFKNLKLLKTKNLFPEDLTAIELIEYLKHNIEEVSAILNNDTIVKRECNKLVAIPYSIEFKEDYKIAAKELFKAAEYASHSEFAKYLRYQAQSLTCNDPEYAYKADQIWANLQNCPLEFTIGRESYEDTFTGSIAEDKEFMKIIQENGISIKAKDFIGARVGIVDVDASKELADYKNHLKAISKLMPFKEKYKQSVDIEEQDSVKQTLADVDLVYLSGDYAARRPGITLAQNLPNDDKLAVQLNAGNRNVFHKQIRKTEDPERRQKLLNSLVDESQHNLYERNADHYFTIGHELAHSLGPIATLSGKDKKVSLGDGYGDIAEECKADLASLVSTEYFLKVNKYSNELVEKIFLTWAVDQIPLSEPELTQAHRVREIMQLNYFIENGAINLEVDGKLKINIEKIIPTANKMLEIIIQIQLDGDADRAKTFVDSYRKWNEVLQYASDIRKSLSPKPYKILSMPLAERLLSE